MAGTGSLAKLTIQAYQDPKFTTLWDDPVNPMSVGINPEKYSQKLGASYTREDAAGGSGQASTFNRDLGSKLQLTLIFDGTGAVPGSDKRTVDQQLLDLWRLGIKINPDIHTPNFLKLVWGSLLFKCRLETLDIDYTLFNSDGTPLRAKVSAGFTKFQENLEGRTEQNLMSPDLTHLVTVRAGDTLPLLCHRIYGDSSYYMKVAEANGLTGFRSVPIGTILSFPPLTGAHS
jgi:nucleoid-associated protein YgaU